MKTLAMLVVILMTSSFILTGCTPNEGEVPQPDQPPQDEIINVPPVANAGADKSITLPTTSVSLLGSATEANGEAITYEWSKVSGGSATIVSPSAASTYINGLVAGTYVFRLIATDSSAATHSDDVSVVVSAEANVPPVANAGADKSITLPTNSVSLVGSATDANGGAITYAWSKVSGGAATIVSPSAASTAINGLVAGTYVFRLIATDSSAATHSDDVSVVVSATGTLPPFANTKIVKVGAGEYCTAFINDQGRVIMAVDQNGWVLKDVGLSDVVDIHGGQYNVITLSSNGEIWSVSPRAVPFQPQFLKRINADASGAPFLGSSKIYAWYIAGLALKDGKIFTWGQDMLNLNGGADIQYPIQFQHPTGKTFTHLSMSISAGYSVMALASDGTVWTYMINSPAPVRINLPSPAIKISNINVAGFVVETATDLLAWGTHGGYFGIPNFTTVPTSIKASFTAAGAVFPTKEIVGNNQTLHIIDQKDEMYGMGSNMQGNIGNGKQYPTWRTHNNPFAWSWANNQLLEGVSKIPGKFKNLTSSDTIAFYFYAQDLGGNWYSWGRNKATSLGNGISLNGTDSSTYPDGLNVPAPTLVTPLDVTWKLWKNASQWGPSTFNPNEPLPPMANAGVNQYLSGVTSTTLFGSGSHQQEGTIDEYSWTKLSGPAAMITSKNSQNTVVTGLTNGTYVFQLRVINHLRVEGLSTVTVVVQ